MALPSNQDWIVIELGPITLGDLAQAAAPKAGPRAGEPSTRAAPSAAAVAALIDEATRLARRLRAATGPVHSRGTLSRGQRGVLAELERSGPRTVPQIARARSVTRQHVQALANALAGEGLVEFADNPVHKRSRLVRLTRAGREWLEELNERETRYLRRLELDVSPEEMRAATGTLRAVGVALANDDWMQAMGSEGMAVAF